MGEKQIIHLLCTREPPGHRIHPCLSFQGDMNDQQEKYQLNNLHNTWKGSKSEKVC